MKTHTDAAETGAGSAKTGHTAHMHTHQTTYPTYVACTALAGATDQIATEDTTGCTQASAGSKPTGTTTSQQHLTATLPTQQGHHQQPTSTLSDLPSINYHYMYQTRHGPLSPSTTYSKWHNGSHINHPMSYSSGTTLPPPTPPWNNGRMNYQPNYDITSTTNSDQTSRCAQADYTPK